MDSKRVLSLLSEFGTFLTLASIELLGLVLHSAEGAIDRTRRMCPDIVEFVDDVGPERLAEVGVGHPCRATTFEDIPDMVVTIAEATHGVKTFREGRPPDAGDGE